MIARSQELSVTNPWIGHRISKIRLRSWLMLQLPSAIANKKRMYHSIPRLDERDGSSAFEVALALLELDGRGGLELAAVAPLDVASGELGSPLHQRLIVLVRTDRSCR